MANGRRMLGEWSVIATKEADPIIAQMAILACIKGDVVLIVSEDTDVFAITLHLYVTSECHQKM